jgi:hypothetical protein
MGSEGITSSFGLLRIGYNHGDLFGFEHLPVIRVLYRGVGRWDLNESRDFDSHRRLGSDCLWRRSLVTNAAFIDQFVTAAVSHVTPTGHINSSGWRDRLERDAAFWVRDRSRQLLGSDATRALESSSFP